MQKPAPHDRATRTGCRAADGMIIAGGGLAAQRCAEALRRGQFEGPIRMLCGEAHPPYDRPPLSKALLTDPAQAGSVAFRPPEWYPANGVDVLTSTRASRLQVGERRLLLSDGTSLRYDKLLIATGGRPRMLPLLSGYENISVLRTLDDARRLRDVLGPESRLAIVGGGFIGLEVAASARQIGAEVTLIEADVTPLRAVLGVELGRWFSQLHERRGVSVRTQVTVLDVDGRAAARALELSDGSRVEVDHVLVGVGIAPDTDWLTGSDIANGVGVPVDGAGRTQAPDVFAAGDVAATWDADVARHVPGSHWEAAARQATNAARLMLGGQPAPAAATSFWSDQYDVRIQYVGVRRPGDELTIDGDLRGRNFSAWFKRADEVVAAVLVNRPRELPAARRIIERRSQ